MSKLELILWAADFIISGVGWRLGGGTAAMACFVVGGILIFIAISRNDKSLQTTPRLKAWHRYGLATFCLLAIILIGFAVVNYQPKKSEAVEIAAQQSIETAPARAQVPTEAQPNSIQKKPAQQRLKPTPQSIAPPSDTGSHVEIEGGYFRNNRTIVQNLDPNGHTSVRGATAIGNGSVVENLPQLKGQAPVTINSAPNGIANSGTIIGNPTVNNGEMPPQITMTTISKNVPEADGRFRTQFRLEIVTKRAILLHLKIVSPSLVGDMELSEDVPASQGQPGFMFRGLYVGPGYAERSVQDVSAGAYIVTVYSSKPETINLEYGPR